MRPSTLITRPDLFQSTLSVRRATKTFAAKRYGIKISIHALREESDTAIIRF